MAMEKCQMLPTTQIAHLSCMIATGFEVPDPVSSHLQQEKDQEIALSFNSKLSQTGNDKCVNNGTISSLRECVLNLGYLTCYNKQLYSIKHKYIPTSAAWYSTSSSGLSRSDTPRLVTRLRFCKFSSL